MSMSEALLVSFESRERTVDWSDIGASWRVGANLPELSPPQRGCQVFLIRKIFNFKVL